MWREMALLWAALASIALFAAFFGFRRVKNEPLRRAREQSANGIAVLFIGLNAIWLSHDINSFYDIASKLIGAGCMVIGAVSLVRSIRDARRAAAENAP